MPRPKTCLQGRDRAAKFRRGLLGTAMVLGTPGLAIAQTAPSAPAAPAPLPPIETRYQRADLYQSDGLDRLIVDHNLRAQFLGERTAIFYRHGKAGARTLRWFDPATGDARDITTEATLLALLSRATGKPVGRAQLAFDSPEFDPATGTFTFGALDKRWRYTADGTLSETPKPQPEPEALSPDGRFRIVARDFNLFAVEVKTGREVALTTDGTREQPYGRSIPQLADILAQGTEDPKMPVSIRWSPDSRHILTWRLDTRDVKRLSITQQNPPGSFYPRSFHYIYPLAGAEKLPLATRYAIDVEQAVRKGSAKLVPLQIPAEALLYPYDPDQDWVAGKPRALWVQRGYGQLAVYQADPDTGTAHVVARETGKPVVTTTSSGIYPAPELGGELDVSERTGWAQLYLVRPDDPDGGIPLSRGEWEIISIEHVDVPGRAILVTGVGREHDRNPYWRQLYRIGLDGTQPVLLTPEPLDHDITTSHDGKWAIDVMSSPSTLPRTVVRDTRDGHIVRELGHADASALLATGYTPPEPFQGVAADGKTPLYGMIYRPAHFDPKRRYPVIDAVYTGPTTTDVPVSWSGTVFNTPSSVAQIGAIVVMIDGRGTSRRGQAFRMAAFQNLGEVGLDDHIAMIRQMAARYPQLDTDRVGVYGGSAGGYDAARFILRRPEFFKVAVASSGNHDLRLDKAWWPETSMGTPDPSVWERNANMSVAANLQGKLLLVHGDIDDNVPVTESYRLANALIQAHRDVDLVILPNTTHRVFQPFFWRKFRDYFVRNLLDEAPPRSAVVDVPNSGD